MLKEVFNRHVMVEILDEQEEEKDKEVPFSMPQPTAGNDGKDDVEFNPQSSPSNEVTPDEKEESPVPVTLSPTSILSATLVSITILSASETAPSTVSVLVTDGYIFSPGKVSGADPTVAL